MDYDPWYWEPEPNTLLTGTIVYEGSQALHNYRIEIVGTVSEQVEHSFEVEYATPFSLAFEIDEPYYVVAKADIVGQLKTLYGSPGGYWLTDTFQPGMTSDRAAFFLEDDLPPIAVVASEPIQEDGHTLFPVYHKLWIYHWDHIDWLYEDGDFRYLKRHTASIRMAIWSLACLPTAFTTSFKTSSPETSGPVHQSITTRAASALLNCAMWNWTTVPL